MDFFSELPVDRALIGESCEICFLCMIHQQKGFLSCACKFFSLFVHFHVNLNWYHNIYGVCSQTGIRTICSVWDTCKNLHLFKKKKSARITETCANNQM